MIQENVQYIENWELARGELTQNFPTFTVNIDFPWDQVSHAEQNYQNTWDI